MTRDPIDELMDGQEVIPDDGFTARVMEALPRPRAASRPLDGWLVALLAGLAAAALAPDAAVVARALADGSVSLGGGLAQALAGSGGPLPATLAVLASALALGVAALGAWLVAEPA